MCSAYSKKKYQSLAISRHESKLAGNFVAFLLALALVATATAVKSCCGRGGSGLGDDTVVRWGTHANMLIDLCQEPTCCFFVVIWLVMGLSHVKSGNFRVTIHDSYVSGLCPSEKYVNDLCLEASEAHLPSSNHQTY